MGNMQGGKIKHNAFVYFPETAKDKGKKKRCIMFTKCFGFYQIQLVFFWCKPCVDIPIAKRGTHMNVALEGNNAFYLKGFWYVL